MGIFFGYDSQFVIHFSIVKGIMVYMSWEHVITFFCTSKLFETFVDFMFNRLNWMSDFVIYNTINNNNVNNTIDLIIPYK